MFTQLKFSTVPPFCRRSERTLNAMAMRWSPKLSKCGVLVLGFNSPVKENPSSYSSTDSPS